MLRARVKHTIEERKLLARGDHVLVACSGGPDSIVLLHVLHALRHELGVTLCVASVDHGLRPESADEVRAVGAFADKLELPFHGLQVTVEPGPSLQARARAARYDALKEAAAIAHATRIAVGHTMDDQAETVLSRILRGAGVVGLAGIWPGRRDGVVRPLIDCLRAEVVEYARFHQLPVIMDPSNQNDSFERVRLRLDVLPILEKEDPQVVAHLAALADDAAEIRHMVGDMVARQSPPEALRLVRANLRALPKPVAKGVLVRWIEAHTGSSPGRDHLSTIYRLLADPGEVFLPSGWTVRPVEEHLVLSLDLERKSRSSGPDRL